MPDGSLAGASEMASIRRVSALAEKDGMSRLIAKATSIIGLLNIGFTSLLLSGK
jgi:hypothetical protein